MSRSRLFVLLGLLVVLAGLIVVLARSKDEPKPTPVGKTVTIFNMVTSGPKALREDTKPLRLFTSPAICYEPSKCATDKPQFRAGDKVQGVVCQTNGARVTNGDDENPIDDHNPGLVESTRWYGVRTNEGVRYFSAVWAVPKDRGGLGLPDCSSQR